MVAEDMFESFLSREPVTNWFMELTGWLPV
jgi:hypothetical protein